MISKLPKQLMKFPVHFSPISLVNTISLFFFNERGSWHTNFSPQLHGEKNISLYATDDLLGQANSEADQLVRTVCQYPAGAETV